MYLDPIVNYIASQFDKGPNEEAKSHSTHFLVNFQLVVTVITAIMLVVNRKVVKGLLVGQVL